MDGHDIITANVIDIPKQRMFPAEVSIQRGRIREIVPRRNPQVDPGLPFMLPGFIDAHIHVESSMLVPSEFARLAVRHGTVATVSDPHEIANVMGIEGIDYMINNGKEVPLKFFFGAPSCVPATDFETAGARIDAAAIEQLLSREDIWYLAEMMNYPGVLGHDSAVWEKLRAAKLAEKPVDGHAPGVMGDDAVQYAAAGISTDHECITLAEAEQKLKCGMKILIREGSAAKNFAALHPLIDRFPRSIMFCSDDKHPDELAESHINALVRRAIDAGANLFHVLAAACINPVDHYRLPVGKLRVGDPADFLLVDDLETWNIDATYIDGVCVCEQGEVHFERVHPEIINRFGCHKKQPEEFAIRSCDSPVAVIKAIDGSLITQVEHHELALRHGEVQLDIDRDILKIAVVNRYHDATPATAFVRGFGITRGAIASSVGHDSHNIIAVGSDDQYLCEAVNQVIDRHGGIAMVSQDQVAVLPLPIAGIMSPERGEWVAKEYSRIDQLTKRQLGSTLSAPFMTLSFMALLVIPTLKLSDRGLFDSGRFQFVESPAG